MKKILLLIFFSGIIFSQSNIDKAFDDALLYRGLTRSDITIPLDTSDFANTNQSKELLQIVYQLMTKPLTSSAVMDKVMGYKDMPVEEIIENMYRDADYDFQPITQYSMQGDIINLISDRLIESKQNYDEMLNALEPAEISYILNNLRMLYENIEGDDETNRDIYKTNALSDSATYAAKRVLDLLSKLDKNKIVYNGYTDMMFFSLLYRAISINGLESGISSFNSNEGFNIIIGTTGDDKYSGNFDIIIEPGGNDVYDMSREYRSGNFSSCIIDLSGNDTYRTGNKYSLAASLFSSAFIFDKDGNDVYRLGSCNLSAATGGIAIMYDENGDDFYEGKDFSVGAALFGLALLYDKNGNDIYTANTFSQGFGMTNGIGAIVDVSGHDNYVVNPRTLDVLRYSDHYLSMCQGYGYGLRPYYAGGIGYIIEGEGNDVYACDIFGQGGSYWYSLGCVVDGKGNDKYTGFHYNQGSGIHLSVGLMKDYEGWDYYNSNWVSQGCGHDYAVGVLWDAAGSDLYACDGLSQGAGNANGIGILIDETGRDGYLSKDQNTQGYGQPSRGFGSIGILLDNSGADYYSQRSDSSFNSSSSWGVKLDNDAPEPVVQTQSNDFRVPVDTTVSYSADELYMFARTMEIQFQNYSGFAFNRMVNDSINTAQYILSKLNSEDIRDIVLIRNFIPKIGWTFSNVFMNRLNDYLSGKINLAQDEINFMLFMIGESKNPSALEVLMKFTQDDRYRVRAAAVTALGKLPLDMSDTGLLDRINVLLNRQVTNPLYYKDLTLPFRVINSEESIPVLIELLRHPFFGVRFNAAEILSTKSETAYKYYTTETLQKISRDDIWTMSFLEAIKTMPAKKSAKLYDTIEKYNKNKMIKLKIRELKK